MTTKKLEAYEAELQRLQIEISNAEGTAVLARIKRAELWRKLDKQGVGKRAMARMSGCDVMLVVRALK